jgi:hypothetical protein
MRRGRKEAGKEPAEMGRGWNGQEYEDSWRFEEIIEKDRKREEKLKAERMVESRKMADEMFEADMKSVGKGQGDHVVLQNHPACACADWIKEWECMFEKLIKIN